MAAAEEQGMQAHCPRCGFTPRAPRTTCPLCARALVTDGPEGTDGRRSAAPLVVLGVGFVLATGGLLVANAIDTDTPPAGMGAGIPRLAPPDSGVLGTTESGGDRKKDPRDGEERTPARDEGEGRGREILLSYAGPSGNGAKEGETKRPDGVGDLADLPPLLPPIGSDEPGGGPPVPPLGDIPGMPPALAPVADVGGVSSGDDDDNGGDGGHGGGGDDDSGASGDGATDPIAVELAEFDRSSRAFTVRLGEPQSEDGARKMAREALAELTTLNLPFDPPVGILRIEGIPKLDGDKGKWIPFCGRFEVEDEDAAALAAVDCQALPSFDDDLLLVPALKDADARARDALDGGDPAGGDAAGLPGGIPELATGAVDPSSGDALGDSTDGGVGAPTPDDDGEPSDDENIKAKGERPSEELTWDGGN